MVAPIMPGLNDHEIERILEAARDAGAREAGYVMLRLPLELKDMFREWLATDFPDRAERVLHLLQSMHGGRDYTAAIRAAAERVGALRPADRDAVPAAPAAARAQPATAGACAQTCSGGPGASGVDSFELFDDVLSPTVDNAAGECV